MPDISMCIKKDCPSFYRCYRAQAKPNDIWQVYQEFDNGEKDKCEDFIKIAVEGTCKP
jgi:hypothetical protein